MSPWDTIEWESASLTRLIWVDRAYTKAREEFKKFASLVKDALLDLIENEDVKKQLTSSKWLDAHLWELCMTKRTTLSVDRVRRSKAAQDQATLIEHIITSWAEALSMEAAETEHCIGVTIRFK